jgi:hypothetical protein
MYKLSCILDIIHISIEKEMTLFMMRADIASSRTLENFTDEID